MVVDVAQDKDDAQVVVLTEFGDTSVEVVGMELVVAQGEEEQPGGHSDLVVAYDVAIFPGGGLDEVEDGVPFLASDQTVHQRGPADWAETAERVVIPGTC